MCNCILSNPGDFARFMTIRTRQRNRGRYASLLTMRLLFPDARLQYFKAGLLCAALSSPAAWAQIELNAVAASDYVVQGVSQTLGDPSLQGGVNYGHRSGLFAGVWVAENRLFSHDDTVHEVDYYLGWQVPTDRGGRWTATLSHYRYPEQPSYLDYDYNELTVAWHTGNGFSVTLGVNDNFYNWERDSRFVEIAHELAVNEKLLFNAGLGYHDTGDAFDRNYRYWHLGLARVFERVTVDLSLVGIDDNVEYIFGDRVMGRRWVLSVVVNIF